MKPFFHKISLCLCTAALMLAAGCSGSNTPQSTGGGEILLGDEMTVSGTGLSVQGTTVTISAGGDYTVSGRQSDGRIEIDTSGEVNLILNGAHLTSTSGAAIYVENAANTTLTLSSGSTNTIVAAQDYTGEDKGTIYSRDDLEITGQGSLTVQGSFRHGIVSNDNLTISSGAITIDAATDGLHANDHIAVTGGELTITAGSDCIESENSILISGGTFALHAGDDGITALNNLTVDGGKITISACYEGLESKDTLTINGGEIAIQASDDALNAGTSMVFNGGQIYLSADGDAIDSNGTIEIHGGLIIALGGNMPEGGIDCDHNQFLVTGGTLIATGGSNSDPSAQSTQPVVLLGSASAGDIIRIEQDGSEILTFEVTKAFRNMVYTSPALALAAEYTVYTGGSVTGGESLYGLYTGAAYTTGDAAETSTTETAVTRLSGVSDNSGPGGGRPGGNDTRGGQAPSGEMPFGDMPARGGANGERGEIPSGGMRPDDDFEGTPPALPEGAEFQTSPPDKQ